MNLTWENAKVWQTLANDGKNEGLEPAWSWDCNFKLDFDGSLLRVSSRFYPPHYNNHDGWDGNVTILFLEQEVIKQAFKCETLDELKIEVEKFVKEYSNKVLEKIKEIN